jgi:hypothetical protein
VVVLGCNDAEVAMLFALPSSPSVGRSTTVAVGEKTLGVEGVVDAMVSERGRGAAR